MSTTTMQISVTVNPPILIFLRSISNWDMFAQVTVQSQTQFAADSKSGMAIRLFRALDWLPAPVPGGGG
jgi:hypothetical protein